jgi:Tfp pilus assembly protein PilF
MDSAQRELEVAAGRDETRAGANLYLGRLALEEGKLAEAADCLRKAIRANPKAPDAYAELALAHIRQNNFDQAAKTLDEALRLAPDHYRSNLNLLMLYQKTKDNRYAEQEKRVEHLRQDGEEREKMLLRSLDLQPYQ